jgi:hypothetical protein
MTEPKTKTFLKVCQDCKVNLDQKVLSNCIKKNNTNKVSYTES